MRYAHVKALSLGKSIGSSINKTKSAMLFLLWLFICRWRAVVDDEQQQLRSRVCCCCCCFSLCFRLSFSFSSPSIMSAQLCTQQQRQLNDLRHAHLLLFRSLAYCMQFHFVFRSRPQSPSASASQSPHLFIICCSYDLRFYCAAPSLRSPPPIKHFLALRRNDYRWPHGSRRRAQLRHLLEFHSTWLRVSSSLVSCLLYLVSWLELQFWTCLDLLCPCVSAWLPAPLFRF